jgi:hypothetical protein
MQGSTRLHTCKKIVQNELTFVSNLGAGYQGSSFRARKSGMPV